jgi:hypothetical protein
MSFSQILPAGSRLSMTFIASMRRHSQVKTPWADFPFFLHSVEFSCVNDSLTSVDFRRRLLSVKRGGCSYRYRLCTTALAGDSQGGGSPLEGGAGGIDACQAPFLGAQRAPGVGGTYPAPACPWGKRERGIKFLVAAGYFCHFRSAHRHNRTKKALPACRSFLCSQLLCQSTAARRLASIRTRK